MRDWLAHGTRLVWVVHPRRRTLTVHRAEGSETMLGEHDEVDGEDVLPGFRYRLIHLFKGLGNK